MRRNIVDGAIFGVAIGAIVFLARWLFDGVLWAQAACVLLGGLLVFGVHLYLQRRRTIAARRAWNAAPRPADSQLPAHSPRLAWGDRAVESAQPDSGDNPDAPVSPDAADREQNGAAHGATQAADSRRSSELEHDIKQ
jgi:hypothetical protein